MHSVNILIVDDEPRNVVALEAALATVECHLVKVNSGLKALKCVLAQDFAVIVLDVHMPDMDGFETASLIRERERSHSTPIIFLTAYDPAGSRSPEGYRLGAVDYLYKPFDPEILRAKVAIFVELYRKTAALEQRTAELTQVTAELVRREEQVRVLNADLEELREEFLATTVHDVQQPITAIKASVQVAIRYLGRPEANLVHVTDVLRRVDAQTNRMSLLLGTLSDASRLTLGRLELRCVDTDLGSIMRQYLDRLELEAADRVLVETDAECDLTGHWDPVLLERVIANLVSNALKFSPPDEPIRARFAPSPDAVMLSVTDSGIGIAEAELPRLFSRYGRAGGALAAGVEGHGLGLFLCKGIVEAHGGRIWAESPGAGRGTSVQLVLPKLAPPSADAGRLSQLQEHTGVLASHPAELAG